MAKVTKVHDGITKPIIETDTTIPGGHRLVVSGITGGGGGGGSTDPTAPNAVELSDGTNYYQAATQTTLAAVLAKIIAAPATEATLALVKAKTDNLDVALSTRTKPADQQHAIVDSSALPTGASTEATLASVLAKIIAAPATEATLASILAKIIAAPATEATLALIKAKTDNLDVALSTRTKPADAQHTIVDSGAITITPSGTQTVSGTVTVGAPLTDRTGSTSITASAQSLAISTQGCGSAVFQVVTNGSFSGSFTPQVSNDGVTWLNGYMYRITAASVIPDLRTGPFAIGSNATEFYQIPCGGYSQVRLLSSSVSAGSAAVNAEAGSGNLYAPVGIQIIGDGSSPTAVARVASSFADGLTALGSLYVVSQNTAHNGTNLDRVRNNVNAAIRASTGVTVQTVNTDITTYNAAAFLYHANVTNYNGGSINVSLQWKDANGLFVTIPGATTGTLTSGADIILAVGPSAWPANTATAFYVNYHLPRTIRIVEVIATATVTFSAAYDLPCQ